MNHLEIILIAISLAMDAAAVSMAAASAGWITNRRAIFRLSFHFGLFQFLAPLAGWFIGYEISEFLKSIDHWLIFAILSFIGFRMIDDSLHPEKRNSKSDPSRGKNLILLSIATSVDAFAIGFSIALLETDIWYPVIMIGVITASISIIAIKIGNKLSERFGKKMEIGGGIILILIGLKILIERLL